MHFEKAELSIITEISELLFLGGRNLWLVLVAMTHGVNVIALPLIARHIRLVVYLHHSCI